MKMYSKDGIEMMEIKDLLREGSNLIMKGKVMGYMPLTVYITPKDIWEGKKFISWSIVWYMPILIFKGFWQFKKDKKNEKSIDE